MRIKSNSFFFFESRKIFLALSFFALGFSQNTTAQIVINEVCSDNKAVIKDQFGNYSDWIELFNTSNTNIQLEGFQLSDKVDDTNPWIFPELTLPSQEHLLLFASGKNLKGNELHPNFKLSKDGEALYLKNEAGKLIDQITIPPLDTDISYGRQPDGGSNFVLFSSPSPNLTNSGDFTRIARPPKIVNEHFFYEQSGLVELTCDQMDCLIRYTTDGALPTDTSLLYQGPIALSKTTTLRFATFLPEVKASTAITHTFFINSPHTLPIVNITMSPEILFDTETGIFQNGPNAEPDFPFYGANYWSEQEYPAHIEFFTKDQELEIAFPIGAKIHGGTAARTKIQKPIRLVARDSFGTSTIVHSFFKEKEVDTFKRLILRNASGDFNIGHMRDAIIHRYCSREQLNVDVQGYRPMAYYVNGQYWGIINLREKADEHYIRYNYDVDLTQLDFLEQDTFLLEGNFMHFDSMEAFANSHDLSLSEHFAFIEENFDLESMCDYFIVQTFMNNSDWPKNNLKLWRERISGAKWRYLLFDLDAAMGRYGWTSFNADGWALMMSKTSVRHVLLLQQFLKNENFRNYLLNRYADLLNTSFRAEAFQEEISNTANENRSEMKRHMARWGGDFDFWDQTEIPRLLKFAEQRPEFTRQHLIDYFQLDGQVVLELNTYPEGAGKIRINTINPQEVPWKGIYFQGIPVAINIEANPGFTFSHWQSLYTFPYAVTEKNISFAFEQDDQITAFFTESSDRQEAQIAPNPVLDLLHVSLVISEATELSTAIYNTNGQLILTSPKTLRNGGLQELNISVEDLAKGVYFLKIIGRENAEILQFFKG